MAAFAHLRREEKLGLGVAVVLHLALVAALIVEARRHVQVIPPAERMTVSLSDDVSLESTAPNPSPDTRAAIAPVLSPESEPIPAPVTTPVPAAVQTPVRKDVSKPQVKPQPPKPAQKPGGGTRLGEDFLKGISAGNRADAGTPASKAGPEVKASIASAMIRQIKPHWRVPEGVDADKLVTILDFDLNPDGTLNGTPRVVRQDGITPSNKPQAPLHAENAIRALRLAAPFDLPKEYYDVWKHLRGIRFDRNL